MKRKVIQSWHKGELKIQRLAGTDKQMAEIGPKFIREFMPQQHRGFFQSLSMIFIGYIDYNDHISASVMFGTSGFIQSPSETELVINTQYSMGDFCHDSFHIGDRIGLVGIEFDTRRRNRVNGEIIDINQKNIKIKVLQSYGNCPKYIQSKAFIDNPDYSVHAGLMITNSDVLTPLIHNIIVNADTFFIASSFNDDKPLNNRGVDISHRGGPTGFVSINTAGELVVEDYKGNGFFNTLGNLYENPTASLLFCDWRKGNVLQIMVASRISWHKDEQPINDLTMNLTNSLVTSKKRRTLYFTPIKIKQFSQGLAYLQTNEL